LAEMLTLLRRIIPRENHIKPVVRFGDVKSKVTFGIARF